MTLTKPQVNRYTRKLYKFLNEGHDIRFKKMRKYTGELRTGPYMTIAEGPALITMDHRGEILSTLIHETLHRFYPVAEEKWILAMEEKIINKLTDRQIKNIIRRLADII